MAGQSDDGLADDLLLEAQRAVGDSLRLLREGRQMSQQAVAAYAGVHQSEWSRLEKGEVDPRLSWLLRAQHLFDVASLESLFGPSPSRRLLGTSGLAKQAPGSPAMSHRVLREVLDLPQAGLERLLKRTTLPAIFSAARVVADRLDFLRGLKVLLFEEESKALKERRELHRLLAREPWIFGDEYTLAVDDESLTAVLQQHLKVLGGVELASDAPRVVREDQSPGIVDLMFSKSIKMAVQQHEHLVVELKRPTVTIGYKEIDQIKRYATAVGRDERFASTHTNWNFWVVANRLDDFAKDEANQIDRPPGLIRHGKGIDVWVKTWSEVLDDCEQRLKFVQANLEYQATRDTAMDYLRKTYEQYLPSTVVPNEAPPSTSVREP